MIIKRAERPASIQDPRRKAGDEAERQLEFYLHRAFADHSELFVLNDLRLLDPDQPTFHDRDGACQIDHLVIHRFGMFIIESKSIVGKFVVRDDGHGVDEWIRQAYGRQEGFQSPIAQAQRQGEFLRRYLQQRREQILGRFPVGLRLIFRAIHGSEHRGFLNMPLQIIVAISDRGIIDRHGGWTEPKSPFQTYVCKADQVTGKVLSEFEQHKRGGSLLSTGEGEYGAWAMKPEEAGAIADFLAGSHEPIQECTGKPHPPTGATATARRVERNQPPASHTLACKDCGSSRLAAKSGPYGYYWRCEQCLANTAMPAECGVCGTRGNRGRIVRIRKDGPEYFRDCESCGMSERIWRDPR